MAISKPGDKEIVMMAFKTWQIGLEIQQQTLRAVAVQRQRQGWQLRHWWHLPLAKNTFREGVLQSPENLLTVLAQWRRELPLQHQLRVAFPTQRTLQRAVPAPDNRLRETARESYLATAAAKQLQMQPAQLSWDYVAQPQDSSRLLVTAARQSEVKGLLSCLAKQRLFPTVLAPGASALPALSPLFDLDMPRFLVHQECDHWLWAKPGDTPDWGWVESRQTQTFADLCQQLSAEPEEIAFSSAAADPVPQGAKTLDAWRALVRLQPPLPKVSGIFTVAIALAIGRVQK
jgi:pilus assembly protein HofM